MGESQLVMKNVSRTAAAKAGKRKPWYRGKYEATAKKEIAKPEAKVGKYYSTEDRRVKLKTNKANNRSTKLKSSLVPGAIVILLAGPFKVNGIPLRRVPQSYVIGTSTVVDVSGADTSSVSDSLFKKPKSAKKKADGPFSEDEPKKPLDAEAKALQAKVDGGVKLDDELQGYLKSKFGLSRADLPHEMSF